MLEIGAEWCDYCTKEKTLLEKLALSYQTKLETINAGNFDDKVLNNKKGYKFYYLDDDNPENDKKVKKYFLKYGSAGVPLNLFFKDGKDVGGVNGYLDETQTIQAIEKYCGKLDSV